MKYSPIISVSVFCGVLACSFFAYQKTTAANIHLIPVPFTTQAPESNWAQPWQDACEETTIVMVDVFYGNRELTQVSAKEEILANFDVKHRALGKSLDENAESMVLIINNFYPWEAKVVHTPTLEQMIQELDNNRPIILPAAGEILNNKHFRSNPPYHTIVLIGYDQNKREFITHEPGTRFGKEFRYSYATVMEAMHDFVPGDTINGPKVAIFTSPKLTSSAVLDGDKDGLTKQQELELGTSLTEKDTDGDGHLDEKEYFSGYSPLVNEMALLKKEVTLLKTASSPKVYRVKNNEKRHIISADVFKSYGWKWNQVVTVSEKFLNQIRENIPLEQ